MTTYRRLTFRLNREREDLLAAEIWSLGSLGMETRPGIGDRIEVRAFFSGSRAEPAAAAEDERWRSLGVELIGSDEIAAGDWMAGYRAAVEPFAASRRIGVDPGEPEGSDAAPRGDRFLLKLPARQAFGVGSHESTRLALELLEEAEIGGLRVLDLGFGTGILCFAALLFGARWVVGVEIDPTAALAGGQNRRLNGLFPALVAGSLSGLAEEARFDLALANLLPHRLVPELPGLAARLRPGGQLIVAGLLQNQVSDLMPRLEDCGFAGREARNRGEWSALRLELER